MVKTLASLILSLLLYVTSVGGTNSAFSNVSFDDSQNASGDKQAKIPKINIPEIQVHIPEIKVYVPEIHIPAFRLNCPLEIQIPEIHIPEIKVHVPKLDIQIPQSPE